MPPGAEVGGPGDEPREHQRRQQEHDRRAEQQPQVHASAATRLVGAVMRDQRVRDQRQHLVEQEQREHVAGHGDAHRGRQCQREADVEARLRVLVVGSHVADRIQRVDDPQSRRDQREQHAERFDLEGHRQPGQHLEQRDCRPRTGENVRQQREHAQQQQRSADQRDALAQVRRTAEERDQRRAGRRHEQRSQDQLLGRPSSRRAHQHAGRLRCRAQGQRGIEAEVNGGANQQRRRKQHRPAGLGRVGRVRRAARAGTPLRRSATHRPPRAATTAESGTPATTDRARARPGSESTC